MTDVVTGKIGQIVKLAFKYDCRLLAVCPLGCWVGSKVC